MCCDKRLQRVDGLIDDSLRFGEVDRGECLRVGAEGLGSGIGQCWAGLVEDIEGVVLDHILLLIGSGLLAPAQNIAEAEPLLLVIEEVLADPRAVEPVEDRHCRTARTFFEVADDFVAGKERDDGLEGAGSEHDLGVRHGGLRGGSGRESVVVRIGAEQLANDGGLAGAGGPEQQDLPIAVISGGQGEIVLANRGGMSG